MEDAEGGHDGRQTDEVGDAGCDDEGDGPVDGDEADPHDLAGFGGERGRVEQFDEDIVIDDYEAYQQPCGTGQEVSTPVPFTPMFPYNAAAISALIIAKTLPAVWRLYLEIPR